MLSLLLLFVAGVVVAVDGSGVQNDVAVRAW